MAIDFPLPPDGLDAFRETGSTGGATGTELL